MLIRPRGAQDPYGISAGWLHRWLVVLSFILLTGSAWAGAINTDTLQQPWPQQRVRHLEVGRSLVTWREHASRREGIFAGMRFTVPLTQQKTWELANDYHDLGSATPGIVGVKYLEHQAHRQVIQVDAQVLWKRLRLVFEVEQEPPSIVRFQLVHHALGTYRGAVWFTPEPAASSSAGHGVADRTTVECATWLQPARPVPMGLVLMVERMMLLRGVRSFLQACQPK